LTRTPGSLVIPSFAKVSRVMTKHCMMAALCGFLGQTVSAACANGDSEDACSMDMSLLQSKLLMKEAGGINASVHRVNKEGLTLSDSKDYCEENACSGDWEYKDPGCAAQGKTVGCWNSDDNYQCCGEKTLREKNYCEENACSGNWEYKDPGCAAQGKPVGCWNSDDNYQCCGEKTLREKNYCEENACSGNWEYKDPGCAAQGKPVGCWNSDDNYQCCGEKTLREKNYCAGNACANWVHKSTGCAELKCWNSDDNYQCCA